MENKKEKIHNFIAELLRAKGDESDFSNADSLVLSGRLDSFSIVEVVVFLEKEFGIDFLDVQFEQNDFDSVDRIVAFLSERN